MQINQEQNNSLQYVFGEFVIKNNGILQYKDKEYHLPPKELAVFILLLEANGDIVSKETIISKVWNTNIVSDESLTRCIYTLRKFLHECDKIKYIETVYGHGYRLTVPVLIVTDNDVTKPSSTLAVFPFRTTEKTQNSTTLHYELIKRLSKYAFLGLDILPASVTNEFVGFTGVHQFINNVNPDYYIMGQVAQHGENWRLFIELINAKTHKLIEHQHIDYNPKNSISTLLSQVICLIVENIPNLRPNKKYAMSSLDSAFMLMTGMMEFSRYTPESLKKALTIFSNFTTIYLPNSSVYCCLGECYFLLAFHGLLDQKHALSSAEAAIEKSLEINPSNSKALALLGLFCALRNDHAIANVLFRQAHLIKPNSPEVYYYQALMYFLMRDLDKALTIIDKSIFLEPNNKSNFLKLLIIYYKSSLNEALSYALNQHNQLTEHNPFVTSIMLLIMVLTGHDNKAKKLLSQFEEESGLDYVSVNTLYAKYLLFGEPIKENIIRLFVDCDKKYNAYILPLIFLIFDKAEFEKMRDSFLKTNDIWSKFFLKEPCFADVEGITSNIHTELMHTV
ncbi:TPA: HilA/EilA family virulence transcriptional regulator [Escherichia coli]|uniref:HilA/EilA family virulence transcriptional regulator n=1 Tax=Escherichia coli TaxID=562 RepID=UPI0029A8F348|nr:HilA/EilA family virulence transcriptional regulator [Escherichia coli]